MVVAARISKLLHRQPRHAAEFVGAVGHEAEVVGEGGGGDPQVVAADELALRHECAADFAAVPFLLKCVTEFTGACV